MNDLIGKQAAIDLFPNDALEWDTYFGYIAPHLVRQMIEKLPSAQPVRYGKWILEQEEYDGYGNWNRWRCSCCGYVRTKGWAATSEGHKPKAMLCEKCGAKMDGGGNNETN